jgi:hypothetical protein
MTFLQFYDPEKNSNVSRSQSSADAENRARQAQRNTITAYLEASPTEQAAFDERRPHQWDQYGGKPGSPNFKPPPGDLVPISTEKVTSIEPVTPTKIDVTTGAGVPGGFDAASVKLPSVETEKIGTSMAAISSKAGALASAISAVKAGIIPPIPGLMDAQSKMNTLKSKYSNKLKDMAKVPDFTKKFKLPTPPRLPSVPDFKSLGIPEIPKLPSLPPVPNVSLPSVPNVSLPSAPSLPNVSVPNIPKLPSIGG